MRTIVAVMTVGAAFSFAVLTASSCSKPAAPAAPRTIASIVTDRGTIEFELLTDVAPKAAENFRLLAQRGYYNGLIFHRIAKGFMIQGGDPKGDGSGGESAWGGTFADEIDPHSALYQSGYKRGSVAMANSGKNTNGSQFFIVQTDFPLPPEYTIFGRVIRGMDAVDAIVESPTTTGLDGNLSKPVKPIVMRKVTVRTEPAPSQ